MKSHLDYLLELKENNKLDEIRDTWAALGSLTVSNKTKVYIKDTLFQVYIDGYVNSSITPSDLHLALVYCSADYKVNNNDFPLIDWENVSIMDLEGRCSLIDGITSPHFRVILPYSDFISITSTINDDYLPYQMTSIDSEISIADDELEIILGEVGVPFLRIEELEYTKEKILNNCIKPALQEYYKYFPIVDQQELGNVGGNVEYEFELPKFCYAVTKAFIAQSSGASGSGIIGKGAYNYMMQTTGGMGMGNGGAFGRGISYRGKAVPGFTGGSDYMSAFLMQRAAQQAMTNYAKREKFRYVRKDKKLYIAGFSSIGGILCVSFAKWSPVWDDVRFDQLNNVRNLCTSYVLQNLGMLRALVKTDIPGNIDYSLYTNRAEKLRDDVLKFWASLPTNFATIIRGES